MTSPCSWMRWRARRVRALRAVRRATPYSQVPSRSGSRTSALAGQDEEGGLEGVLGEVAIGKELAADAEYHRAVPHHQGGEGGLVATVVEPLDELAVGEPDERAIVEERPELTGDRGCGQMRHARGLLSLGHSLRAMHSGLLGILLDRRLGLADADIAQLDGLAGPDDELAADLGSVADVAGDDAGAVHDAIGRTRYHDRT